MSHRTEIDKELARLESMARGQDLTAQEPTPVPPDQSKGPNWFLILGVAILIDIAARLFIPSDSFVRLFEAVIFAGAGVALILPVVKKLAMSTLRRRIHSWVAAALGLGAVRSLMWGLGVPVQYANLTILLIALVGAVVAYFVKRRFS